jgi:type IV pilus assembly protein PilB
VLKLLCKKYRRIIMMLNKLRLGDLLIAAGKLSSEQLRVGLDRQRATGKRLGDIFVSEGMVREEDIAEALETQLGIKRVALEFFEVDTNVVRLITANLANKHNLLPVSIKNKKIQVVMSDPLNIIAVDDVRIATGYEVEPIIATSKEIKDAINKYYSSQLVMKAANDLSKEQGTQKAADKRADEANEDFDEVKNAPVVRLVDTIIENAVRNRASDIHVEPFEEYVKVRYRIDGDLIEELRTPLETKGALITRLKILAGLNIAEKRVPQDGRILTKIDDKSVDLRVSVLPTVNGEKVVIRILSRDNFLVGKNKLGMGESDMKKLERIISNPHGIILVTGPTGSGKSTTLYTLLSELNTESKNLITVEDPVEFLLEGINQVGVNNKAGLTFAAGLRSILRQDPDIIMIGEIRDSETAEIATRAAITGHLVLSTIHTNDAPSSMVRLVDMGIEPYLIATSLCGVVAQRLVRRICPQCGEYYEASDYEKKLLNAPSDKPLKLKRGKGCTFCNNTGYKGRVGIYEIMEVTREHRELMLKNASTDELKDLCVKLGMKTLKEACEQHVLEGVTSVEELMRVAFLKE